MSRLTGLLNKGRFRLRSIVQGLNIYDTTEDVELDVSPTFGQQPNSTPPTANFAPAVMPDGKKSDQ